MRIRGEALTSIMEVRGVTPEQLGGAIERTGLKGKDAVSAVRNWMANRDHPRCKSSDLAKLANALGVAPKDLAKFTSVVFHHRGSPRKAKLLTDLVRGKSVLEAENLLTFTTKRAALNVKKALKAAVADAEQSGADVERLYVSESKADDATRMKRFQPKDRGRAHPIIKRFTHITISVQERQAKGGRA